MLPRIVLFAVVSFLTLSSMAQTKPSRKPAKQPTTANQIHASSLVIDSHADTTQRLLDENFDMANPPAGDLGNLDFAKAKAGNLDAEFFSIWVEPKEFKGQYAHRTLALIDSVYQQAAKHPDKMMMAFSPWDIE
ncbi:MAG TPA: membrane dipeptidase, partial [Terriglobales bacterium]|nr:membrane dipeptidase [Terriglobales bacterium]